ncbi:MAG: twitching motility protein PilT [Methanobacteriaceae archaeon]|nr:twitching motility protein PilT [Methanobacteriaceae archaeon]
MIPAQFNVDIISELEQKIPSYKFIVPSIVIRELEKIKNHSKGKNRIAASVALKIASSEPVKIIEIKLKKNEKVDDALLRISKVLCTNDRELRRKARLKNIPVIYLRQRKYLAIDGYVPEI